MIPTVGCGAIPSSDPPQGTWVFPPAEELLPQEGMPDPFVKSDGSRIASTKEWPAQRAYLKAMLAHYQIGRAHV